MIAIGSVIINTSAILVFNTASVLAYFYTLILFFVLQYIIADKDFLFKNFLVLQVYVLLALLLFSIQLYVMPDWNGFSGKYGVGTDDSKFYAGLTENIASIPEGAIRSIGMDHSFVQFLNILYPFGVHHPLSIIIPNLIGICFIPYFTWKTAYRFLEDIKISKIAFLLVLVCPVILSNGLILMRDGWTAFLTIAGIYYLIEKKYLGYLIILLVLSYIRLGSGLLLAIVPLFYFWRIIFSGSTIKKILKIGVILILIVLFFSFGIPFIIEYLLDKGVAGFSRTEFVETFIRSADDKSIIYFIYTLPIYQKIPIGFVFFFFMPFLTLQFFTEGILNIRNIMFTTIMPILSLVYFKYLISGVIYFLKNDNANIKRLFYVYCFMLLIISQISIQPRHKTTIMPLFYILVAYGVFNNNKISRQLGVIFAIFLGVLQIIVLI